MSIQLIIFAVVLLVIILNFRTKLRQKKELQRIAMMLGLEYSDGTSTFDSKMSDVLRESDAESKTPNFLKNPANVSRLRKVFSFFALWEMKGRINGVPVRVLEDRRSSGKNSQRFTRFETKFSKNLDLGLMIRSESFFSKIGQSLLNQKDIQTGNAELDSQIKVRGQSEDRIRSLLNNPEIQQALLEAYRTHSSIVVNDEGVHLEFSGIVTDIEKYKSTLEALSRVCLPIERSLRFQR